MAAPTMWTPYDQIPRLFKLIKTWWCPDDMHFFWQKQHFDGLRVMAVISAFGLISTTDQKIDVTWYATEPCTTCDLLEFFLFFGGDSEGDGGFHFFFGGIRSHIRTIALKLLRPYSSFLMAISSLSSSSNQMVVGFDCMTVAYRIYGVVQSNWSCIFYCIMMLLCVWCSHFLLWNSSPSLSGSRCWQGAALRRTSFQTNRSLSSIGYVKTRGWLYFNSIQERLFVLHQANENNSLRHRLLASDGMLRSRDANSPY